MSEFISMLPPPGPSLQNYDPTSPHHTQAPNIPEIFRDAMSVREEVYVEEQKIPLSNEYDLDDARCYHWVAYASVGTSSSAQAPSNGVPEHAGRKGSTANKLAVGTIRLVPPPHPPHPEPGSSHAIDNNEGLPKELGSGLSGTAVHDGREPYVKLGRLAVLQPFRKLGLARLLINAALSWASANALTILPPISPAAAEQRKLELGGLADVDDVWKGLVLVHAQADIENVWRKFGFEKDESMGTWDEEGIVHLGMWKRIQLEPEGRKKST